MAGARHWISDAEKEWAECSDTMLICYVWKQLICLKIGSK